MRLCWLHTPHCWKSHALAQIIHIQQASKYLKIGTCPASQKVIGIYRKTNCSLEISKFSLALLPEALVNMSGRVLFSRPDSREITLSEDIVFQYK